ncbi:MAG: type II toxin-antitoxin system Phd/YefM family antitoxin [Candidatus Microthrix subdominans]|jgi:antitoxin Phd
MSNVGVAEARRNLASVIRRAQREPVVIARRGRAQAVVVSPEHFEVMRDALEQIEDAGAFDEAMAEEGENLPWEQAKSDLGWE